MINKKPWLSKTLWVQAICAVALLAGLDGVKEFIVANVEIVGLVWAGLNALLRLVSSEKISLND